MKQIGQQTDPFLPQLPPRPDDNADDYTKKLYAYQEQLHRRLYDVLVDKQVRIDAVIPYTGTGGLVLTSDVTGVYPGYIKWAAGGGGGGTTITVKDEGVTLSTTVDTLDFIGPRIAATGSGSSIAVTVPALLTTKGDVFTFSTVETRLAVGTDNFVLLADSSTGTGLRWGTVGTGGAGAVTALDFLWGSQQDGAATLDGTNTFTWATKVGSVYTLSRNPHLTTLTINGGATLNPGGYRAYGLSLVNNGSVNGNGVSGVGNAAGAQAHTGFYMGTNGDAGSGGVGAQNGGDVGVLAALAGGQGGRGGGSGVQTGGLVSPQTLLSSGTFVTAGGKNDLYAFGLGLLRGAYANEGATINRWNGGGGGSGGASIAGSQGGGGGTGGEVISLFFKAISGSGTITANGGNGGNSVGLQGGGGGAGGGGVIQVATTTAAWATNMSASVAAGTAGTSSGAATAPTAAQVGTILSYIVS